jgi:serpin B
MPAFFFPPCRRTSYRLAGRGPICVLIQRNLINQDTRLILTNAIYFKGKWEAEFKKAKTIEEEWHGPKVGQQVPMMHQKGDFLYYENDELQALDLPYKGGQLSMLVVLPKKEEGLTSLESTWSATGTFQQITKRLCDETVIVSLPRFKMEAEFRLKPVLCDMGADFAFGNEADFSGIGDEPLKIAEVVHKAFVEVNEEGTEAAAATGVDMAFKSAFLAQPKVFKADHPFLFFIRDRKTNTMLFSGRVVDTR